MKSLGDFTRKRSIPIGILEELYHVMKKVSFTTIPSEEVTGCVWELYSDKLRVERRWDAELQGPMGTVGMDMGYAYGKKRIW